MAEQMEINELLFFNALTEIHTKKGIHSDKSVSNWKLEDVLNNLDYFNKTRTLDDVYSERTEFALKHISDGVILVEIKKRQKIDKLTESGKDLVMTELLKTQIKYIGDDPAREGVMQTPERIIKSWKELYKGYSQDPKDLLTVFDGEGYDQIVLLSDIEMFSTCEHHMLPFYGRAHVAYIPNEKVIGISKLARLLDIYARRLQIQERIGMQVTNALMQYLEPKGAACIIEAKHMCMQIRGVQKQNSIMKTSSMQGVFMKDSKARNELLDLIKNR